MSILLDDSDILAFFINGIRIELHKFIGSDLANEYKKTCDYYDDKFKNRIVDESIRKCYKYNNIDVSFKNINTVLDEVQNKFSNHTNIRLIPREILEYGEGCFFDSHTDGKKFKDHIGNAILLPPKNLFTYSGGTLFVDNKKYSASTNKWKLVIIPMDVEHYITPVRKGTRVVIKFGIKGKSLRSTSYRTPLKKIRKYKNGRKD